MWCEGVAEGVRVWRCDGVVIGPMWLCGEVVRHILCIEMVMWEYIYNMHGDTAFICISIS